MNLSILGKARIQDQNDRRLSIILIWLHQHQYKTKYNTRMPTKYNPEANMASDQRIKRPKPMLKLFRDKPSSHEYLTQSQLHSNQCFQTHQQDQILVQLSYDILDACNLHYLS